MFGGLDKREIGLVFLLLMTIFAGSVLYRSSVETVTPIVDSPPRANVKPTTVVESEKIPAENPTVQEQGAKTPQELGQIDINDASAEELELLPLIGPAKAAAIVLERESNGLFPRVDDLVRVPGIGIKTLERLKPYIIVSEIEPRKEVPVEVSGKQPNGAEVRVRINHADIVELQKLKGVGEVMAARILEDRQQRGPFRTPEALMRVKGIGTKTLEKNRNILVFD